MSPQLKRILLASLFTLIKANNSSTFCQSGILLHAAICLPPGYSKFKLPNEGSGSKDPVHVALSIKIIDVLDVGTSDQTVQLGMSLTMRWREPRMVVDEAYDFGGGNNNGSGMVSVEAALVDQHLWRPGGMCYYV